MSHIVTAVKRFFVAPSATPEEMAAIAKRVDSMIESAPIAVFSKSYCPYCVKAKKILSDKGQSANMKVLELDHDPAGDAIQTYLAKKQGVGRVTVPQIYISTHLVGGCSDLTALSTAQLDKMLAGLPKL
ncbi:uncharacterized protein L969DRAFT_89943 [Mixia osmundae IAM 14324]|uniref:Glutaredoxin domain-containing protein n=1 Tax=Mixia osmundae (strain CBS 9802 / IAM 14324 / JCM 22182 / KY 12970) TaxID=764103 RepID=G7DUX7_MIXOS|nr:uncharacterized protein L969DRAFT_89943 [Mixia osmundae IAM 14324]KEI37396.1 hypothetical protein L969DRAFT_89943 [Mixia osmundae IAM 14324]GAA94387.1 hypothetical protein E5Q_01038 [Mixia osmundae IAM 14324]